MTFTKKIRPLGNRVLIKRADAQVTQGGIILPDSAQEKPKKGEILAVGPGKTEEDGKVSPMDLKVGDFVLFSSFAGTEVGSDNEEKYLIMSEDDILAVIS